MALSEQAEVRTGKIVAGIQNISLLSRVSRDSELVDRIAIGIVGLLGSEAAPLTIVCVRLDYLPCRVGNAEDQTVGIVSEVELGSVGIDHLRQQSRIVVVCGNRSG